MFRGSITLHRSSILTASRLFLSTQRNTKSSAPKKAAKPSPKQATKPSSYGTSTFRLEMPSDPVRRERFIKALLSEAQMNPNHISPEISHILTQEGLLNGNDGLNSQSSIESTPQARALNAVGRVLVSRKLHPDYSNICKKVYPITKQIRSIFKHTNLSRFDIFVSLVMEKEIAKLNKSFRDVDAPTDVLSFPVEQPIAPGQPVEFGDVADLGELYICVPYCDEQVRTRNEANPSLEQQFTLDEEISVVLVHGVLHLAGYDHHTASARAQMQAETERVLALMVSDGVISKNCIQLSKLFVLEEAPEEAPELELEVDEETAYLHGISVAARQPNIETTSNIDNEEDEDIESDEKDNQVDIDQDTSDFDISGHGKKSFDLSEDIFMEKFLADSDESQKNQ